MFTYAFKEEGFIRNRLSLLHAEAHPDPVLALQGPHKSVLLCGSPVSPGMLPGVPRDPKLVVDVRVILA
ncbi:hypothetical protein PAPYR_7053 [Paratrimastix pyriformis]|uniref:Uncharacterized protein n=1 Tax=Paratrimastix pyriformis TaxID=342808 RepID=A0ABQ8UDW9_9EUKA|nr:hypothetical protein PAPYR_7053 [Paratrimastix pyriformis]